METVNYHTFPAGSHTPQNVVFPQQTHSANIREVITGNEDLTDCDGIWTSNSDLILGIKTADCAPVVFIGKNRFGIAHAGWRGLRQGILEKMKSLFAKDLEKIWIGPLYPEFIIQKDDCYRQLRARFGGKFFDEQKEGVSFRFLAAVCSVVPDAEFCGISTFHNSDYASWRRDRAFPKGQNLTLVGNFD